MMGVKKKEGIGDHVTFILFRFWNYFQIKSQKFSWNPMMQAKVGPTVPPGTGPSIKLFIVDINKLWY
jgi:hypothetical protein